MCLLAQFLLKSCKYCYLHGQSLLGNREFFNDEYRRMTKNLFYGEGENFVNVLLDKLSLVDIDVSGMKMDHLCYRCEYLEEYQEMKKLISEFSILLTEEIIGGRPISTFLLDRAIESRGRKIYLIELPQPKEGSFYKSGFEHAEFVIQTDLHSFAKAYSSLNFDRKGMKKTSNADLRLSLGGGFSVKFHENHLSVVIAEEKRKPLSACKEYYVASLAESHLRKFDRQHMVHLMREETFKQFWLANIDAIYTAENVWEMISIDYQKQYYGLLGIFDRANNYQGFVGFVNWRRAVSGLKLQLLHGSGILEDKALVPFIEFLVTCGDQMGHRSFICKK